MKHRWKTVVALTLCLVCSAGTVGSAVGRDWSAYDVMKTLAVRSLSAQLDDLRSNVYVYRDFALSENHFTQKAKIFGLDGNLVHNMDEDWRDDVYAGDSCIRCELESDGSDWGGWLFLNGYLPEGDTQPQLNDGKQPDAALDLTGATALRFYAKGEKGGEVVEFFSAGYGYDGATGDRMVDCPDSAGKQTLGFVTLTDRWTEYVIPLLGENMSRIACGFGFVLSGTQATMPYNVFYLDEIRFDGKITSMLNAPVMLRSYATDNPYIRNAAFSYDNALVAMAFLSEGMLDDATVLLDAFVYAVSHDRHAYGRVRNAYAAGDIRPFPGWASGARLPGWYDLDAGDSGAYFEDRYQVGSNVGNTSYVALALLHGYQTLRDPVYLETAKLLMDWVIDNCSGGDGFTAGFDGWAEGENPVVYPFSYKSIEHNIDAFSAFRELYTLTGEAKFAIASDSARRFINTMFDEDAGVFYTGTTDDGITANTGNIVLDAQVWAALALGDGFSPYQVVLDRVEAMRVRDGGYPFCEANENGGWWAEGTAYTALMYRLRGEYDAARQALDALCAIQLEDGTFSAATVGALSTGFDLFDGSPWVYTDDSHIAPTAWFVLALNGFNPYDF